MGPIARTYSKGVGQVRPLGGHAVHGRGLQEVGPVGMKAHIVVAVIVTQNENNKVISDENRAYLRSLPAHFHIEYGVNTDPYHLLLVHGSPRKINEYLFEDRPDKSMIRMMEKAGTHLMAFGHTHQPFHKILEDRGGKYRHAINIGSVGKPKDGDPRACYAALEWDGDLDLTDPGSLSVEFIRVDYDVEKAAKAVEKSPLPNPFADMLRNGG